MAEKATEIVLQADGVCKSYGVKRALLPTTLAFSSRSFTCIVGRSGCGKTTLLRLLGGLDTPDAGSVQLADGLRIAPVFQEPRLMSWLTVVQNITLAAKADKTLDAAALPQLLQLLGLAGCEELYPHQLSGGMAQRVALGRTLFLIRMLF